MLRLPFLRRDGPTLAGERIVLRMPVDSDYRAWSTLRAESRAFLEPWEPRWSSDELERAAWRFRLKRTRDDFAAGTSVALFLFDRTSQALLGGITLGNIRRGVSQSGHIGYWIGERHAGRGYMAEALRLLCEHAFGTLKLHRVEAACIPRNVRSMRVLEKVGFQREGLLRSYLKIDGLWQDHLLYALLATDKVRPMTRT